MTVLLTARHDGGENQANILSLPGQQEEGACADAGSRNQTQTTHLRPETLSALDTNNLTRHFQYDSQ